jgi:phosphoglycolate phosphatase-like HAD superfamily hydrolase
LSTLPRAVLFDVDGTLAIRDETDPNVRHFAAWDRVGEDLPNVAVIELAQLVAESGRYKLVVMSGRDEVCRRQTEMWLDAQEVAFDELYMRRHKDNRPDNVVKEELYRKHIEGRYEIAWVVDDRMQVVRMWRDVLGLTVFQCAPGEF